MYERTKISIIRGFVWGFSIRGFVWNFSIRGFVWDVGIWNMEKYIIYEYVYEYRPRVRVRTDDTTQSYYKAYAYRRAIEIDVKKERRVDVRTRESTRV